jgi:hypothetical protein
MLTSLVLSLVSIGGTGYLVKRSKTFDTRRHRRASRRDRARALTGA